MVDTPPVNDVVIIGGSLAGLMHACVILHESPTSKVTILERSPGLLHDQGAGIVCGQDVQQLFTECVRPRREITVTSRQRLYLDRHGNEMDGSIEDRAQQMTSWDLLYRMLRWRVDGREADEYFPQNTNGQPLVPPNEGTKATYRAGCTVTGLKSTGEGQGVKVTFVDGSNTEQSISGSLVIAADGANSFVRRRLLPQVARSYAGYVAFRGTVPERELSEAAASVFVERFPFFHAAGTQSLGYAIPGPSGDLRPGKRFVNWVWYRNYQADSSELAEVLTDSTGHLHHTTLPVGGMQTKVWETQKSDAYRILPPQFAELVNKTQQPFVQAIMDVISPENFLEDDQVIVVGDALAGFRPHTAASTSQAAVSALALRRWMQKSDNFGRDEYRKGCLEYARELQRHGVRIGDRSQFGQHPLADNN